MSADIGKEAPSWADTVRHWMGENDVVLSNQAYRTIIALGNRRATPQAPTPAAAEGQAVVFWDKAVGGFYIAGSQIPDAVKARAEPLYAAPLPRQAAVKEVPSEPVKAPMTYEQFMDEAERTGLTLDALMPGVVARLAEMEAQGVIRKHEDGGHEYVAAPGDLGQ